MKQDKGMCFLKISSRLRCMTRTDLHVAVTFDHDDDNPQIQVIKAK